MKRPECVGADNVIALQQLERDKTQLIKNKSNQQHNCPTHGKKRQLVGVNPEVSGKTYSTVAVRC